MRSVVDMTIDAEPERVARLYSDQSNTVKWMDDLDRCDPIGGDDGMPGSTYRMVSKDGRMNFVATVVALDLPRHVELQLNSEDVTVGVDVRMSWLPEGGTRFISTETFRFKGALHKGVSLLARRAIKAAHRRHMEGFKRFVEGRSAAGAAPRTARSRPTSRG